MPISYEIDERVGLVSTRICGHVGTRELAAFTVAARADDRVRACPRSLIDCSEVAEFSMDARVIRELGMTRPSVPGRKIAIVVPTDAAFGLARMYQSFGPDPAHDGASRVFRDRDAALAWLQS